MPTVSVQGAEIYYQTIGSGTPILLIPGFGCDHLIWGRVAQTLAARYRVVMFDHRGVGRTTGTVEGLALRTLADDAIGLLQALRIEKVHVLGHSMGGMVAQELAITRPELVQSLILVSSCARLDARGRATIDTWGNMPSRVDPETAARLVLPWMYTNAFFELPGAVDNLVQRMLANSYPPTAEAILAQSLAVQDADTTNRLGQITARTLVLVGREDILTPVRYSQQLARLIASAKLVVLDETGHGLLVETPDAVVGAVAPFLESFD